MKKPNITHDSLFRELSKQTFENEEEVSEFMEKMMGGEMDSMPKNKRELAQELVQSAYSSPFEEAISECKEMLELNPGDNQGIRYLLSTLLLQTKKYDDFEAMVKDREKDTGIDWLYNLALYKFIKTGKSKSSNEALLKAYKKNKFVIYILLGKREISNETSDYVTLGSEEEAGYYVGQNGIIWIGIENSFDWIYDFQETRKRIN
jgi:Transcriptional repressor TCF25